METIPTDTTQSHYHRQHTGRGIALLVSGLFVLIAIIFLGAGIGQHGRTLFSGTSAPNLERHVVGQNVDPTLQKQTEARIIDQVALIKKDPNNFGLWIDLATMRQTIGDYEGAADVLLYVIDQNPRSLAAYNNLGNLYHFYMKDFAKAERAFRKVVELDPSYIAGYRNLYDLYRLSFKDNQKALGSIDEGLVNNPDNLELLMVKGAQYLMMGDKANAKLNFEKALVQAKKGTDQEMIDYVQVQIDEVNKK